MDINKSEISMETNEENDLVNKEIENYYSSNNYKRKIILVGHSGGNGGAEILLKNLICEFQKQDIEVSVLVKFDGPIVEEYKKYAPTFVIDTTKKIEYYITELSKSGYKSVILNTTLCGNLISECHKNNIFCINLVHELPGVIKRLNAEEYVKFVAEQADLTVFPSTYVCEKFEGMCEVKKQKLIQPQGFYNAYDNFNKSESRKKLAEKHNIPKDHNIVLNVGMGEFRKGFDLFVDAARKLKNDNYTFIWVGVIEDDIEKIYHDELNNLQNMICTGFISDKEEIMRYYDACDVFLLTSREDPFPSVVLEAFNAKKPVIGFEDAGGFCDIVINNESGFLVEYESVNEMVNKIRLICEHDDLKESLGDNAKRICDKHSFSDYVKTLNIFSINGEIIIDLENDNALKKEQINLLEHEVSYLKDDIYSKSNKISFLERKNEESIKEHKKELSKKDNQILKLKRTNKKFKKQNNEILSSSSWKVTKPLRGSKHYAKKVLNLKNKFKSEENSSNSKTKEKIASKNKKQKKLSKNTYSVIKTYPYSYNTYITYENLKRINIFFDRIDGKLYRQTKLFQFITEYCNKYEYSLRIIYNKADFEKFNFFINANHIKLPKETSFLNLKRDNYLEIGLNEKYICTSWKNAKCLLNNRSINSIIYYYLDDLSKHNDIEYYRIANICYNNNVVILSDDNQKLKLLKNFQYDFDVEVNKKIDNERKILCCDFGDMIIEGIELLNYLLLNSILDVNKWEINVVSNQKISKFYKDSNKLINHITEKLDDCDIFLKLDLNGDEKFISQNDNYIKIHLKKIKDTDYKVLDISDIANIDYFNIFVPSKLGKNKQLMQIGEMFNNINEVK